MVGVGPDCLAGLGGGLGFEWLLGLDCDGFAC